MIRRILVSLAVGAMIAVPNVASAQSATGSPYLFELISRPAFKNSFDAMFKGEANVDGWLKRYTDDKNGPAGPSKTYVVDGRSRIGGSVCMAHNCGENQFYYLFVDDGSKVVGLLIKGKVQRWFGVPSAAEKTTLLQISRSRS